MYRDIIDLIVDGQPVNAATANRPLVQIHDNVRYLKNVVDSMTSSSALIHRQAVLENSTEVGQPVYFHYTNQRYEKAVADGTIRQQVAGLVLRKDGPQVGDVILAGYAPDLSLAAAVSSVVAGRYWLSSTTPGGLVTAAPEYRLPLVCRADGTGKVWVHIIPVEPEEWNHRLTSASGSTTNSNTVVSTFASSKGVLGVATVRNTGSTNSLTVRVEVSDAFSTVANQETNLTPGASLLLNLANPVGAAVPPYLSYTVLVRSSTTDAHTTYSIRATTSPA